jgi:glutaredoxin
MIKFYSTGCPVCNQIKALMDKKEISYEYISDMDLIMKVADENNIMSAPFAEVDGKILTANELKQYINTL